MKQFDLFDPYIFLFPWQATHPLVVRAAVAIDTAASDAAARPIWRQILAETFDPLHRAGVPFDLVHAHAAAFRDAVQIVLDRLAGPDGDGTPQSFPEGVAA